MQEQMPVTVGDPTGDAPLDEGDCQVAEGRDGLGAFPVRTRLPLLVAADMTAVVESLDAPVAAHQTEKVTFTWRSVRRQACHAVTPKTTSRRPWPLRSIAVRSARNAGPVVGKRSLATA
jgi:hypothetical protein